jgi:hypothetical protein
MTRVHVLNALRKHGLARPRWRPLTAAPLITKLDGMAAPWPRWMAPGFVTRML